MGGLVADVRAEVAGENERIRKERGRLALGQRPVSMFKNINAHSLSSNEGEQGCAWTTGYHRQPALVSK